MPSFSPPDFSTLTSAPDAKFVAAPSDGVLPEGFFSSTNLPTYVRRAGKWITPREPRMDSAIVLTKEGELYIREGRRVNRHGLPPRRPFYATAAFSLSSSRRARQARRSLTG